MLDTSTSFGPASAFSARRCARRSDARAAAVDTVRLAPGSRIVDAVADTSYAPCGDLSLAYQVFGDGPIELVFAGPFISHVELFWTVPEYKAFFDQLATFCRIVVFDKAGVGLSTRSRTFVR